MKLPFSESVALSAKKGLWSTVSSFLITIMVAMLSPATVKMVAEHAIRSMFGDFAVRRVNGFQMVLSLRDRGIHRDLFINGKREPLCTDRLMWGEFVGEGDVVLDIGANIGYYVLPESRLVDPSGKVYAVEPVSGNVASLRRNLDANRCDNVEIFKLAMDDRNGRAKIHVSDMSNLCAFRKNPDAVFIGEEDVEVVTVDNFLEGKETPRLIRMDVEGHEINIIRGMTQTLREDVKLLIEVHGSGMTATESNEFIDALKRHGFKVAFAALDHCFRPNRFVGYVFRRVGMISAVVDLDMEQLRNWLVTRGECVNVLFTKEHATA